MTQLKELSEEYNNLENLKLCELSTLDDDNRFKVVARKLAKLDAIRLYKNYKKAVAIASMSRL